MGKQLLLIIGMAAAAIATWVMRIQWYPHATGYGAYGLLSLGWLTSVLTLILALNFFWQNHRRSRYSNGRSAPSSRWLNRRQSFRIVYPPSDRPVFMVESADAKRRRLLEYPVDNLSREGVCFIDDGSLGMVKKVSGVIRLGSGEQIKVRGTVVRMDGRHVRVRLESGIIARIHLEEQRRALRQAKCPTQSLQ